MDGPLVPVTISKLSKTELERGTVLTVHTRFDTPNMKFETPWVKRDRREMTCDIRLANGKVLRHVPPMLCEVALGDEGLVDVKAQKIARTIRKATPLVCLVYVLGSHS